MQTTNRKIDIYDSLSKYRDEIKGLAALWILIFHDYLILSKDIYTINIETVIKRLGFCGVDIFFFLLGMGLYVSLSKNPPLKTFYKKRLSRLILPIIISGIISAFVRSWSLPVFLRCITGYLFVTYNINVFLWFGFTVIILYLIFPLFYKAFIKSRNKYIFIGDILVIWLILSILLKNVIREDLYSLTNRIPIILLGTLFTYHTKDRNISYSIKNTSFMVISLIAGVILGIECTFKGLQILFPVSDCCLPNILMTIGIISLSVLLLYLLDKKENGYKVLKWFGKISFELYCVQEGLNVLFMREIFGNLPWLIQNVVVLGVTILAGYVLYLLNTWVNKALKCASKPHS